MRIILLTSSLNSGGAERVATTLCNAWAARGDSVTLIPTYSGGGKPFYEVSKQVELVFLASTVPKRNSEFFNYFVRFWTLRKLLKERNPDVVISFLPNVNVAAILAAAFTGLPVIICERSDPSKQPYSWFWKLACKITYPFADMLTVQTEAVATKARDLFKGVRRVYSIPNPLPDQLLDYQRIDAGERKILLSIGRLTNEKQVSKIIDGFVALALRFPDWDLHIYGDGPLKSTLEAQIRSVEMQHRVFLKGRTDRPWEAMATASIYVLTSSYEGFPNSMLEAMGVGLPCVAFDCQSGPSELSEKGMAAKLVKLNDQEALILALANMMGDKVARDNLGVIAQTSVRRRFALNAIIKRWDRLFGEVGAVR